MCSFNRLLKRHKCTISKMNLEFLQDVYPHLMRTGLEQKLVQQSCSNTTRDVVAEALTEVVERAESLIEAGIPQCEVSYLTTSCADTSVDTCVLNISTTCNIILSFQILRFMRTNITLQGKPAVAICLDDLQTSLTATPIAIRTVAKDRNMGKHDVSKDFVPVDSKNPFIRRNSNSRSRKCTVVWLEDLPSLLQERLQKVSTNRNIFEN